MVILIISMYAEARSSRYIKLNWEYEDIEKGRKIETSRLGNTGGLGGDRKIYKTEWGLS